MNASQSLFVVFHLFINITAVSIMPSVTCLQRNNINFTEMTFFQTVGFLRYCAFTPNKDHMNANICTIGNDLYKL